MIPTRHAGFLLLCALTGLGAGLGAVAFRALIALVHNALFYGRLSLYYDANAHTAISPWGPFVAFAPIIGALGVTFLVTRYAPEAGGTGVPEVMAVIFYRKGKIRPVASAVKALASSLSLGSGGSAGREGPIIQIGAGLGSLLGNRFSLSSQQLTTLIACGAGGGIAATYDTPVGGILFVAEILLNEVSAATLVPLALSTAAAALLGRAFFGDAPALVIPSIETAHASSLPALITYAGLGVVTGLFSVLFIRFVFGAEDFFNKNIKNPYVRHVTGMLPVGVTMYLLLVFSGHYHIEGVGYATIQDVLAGRISLVAMLLLLAALKLLATSATLGSGGSGGIFSPALFLGAMLGGAFGFVVRQLIPGIAVDPVIFAMVGMAGMVAGTTGAALAAIVMIMEITHLYSAAIPVTIAAACGLGVRRVLLRDSMYTMKLSRRGHAASDVLLRDVYDLKHIEK
jgi:CIC family chloride channel protein